jgi:hypothetical protein
VLRLRNCENCFILTPLLKDENLLDMKKHSAPADPIRRDVLKKAVFVAPVILTLPVTPSFAQKASGPKAWPKPEKPKLKKLK